LYFCFPFCVFRLFVLFLVLFLLLNIAVSFLRGEVRKQVSLFYCHQITSHSEMPLYALITLFTSLIFPHNHLLFWGTLLGGKSIFQTPVNRSWDPDHAAMFPPHAWHYHVIWIACLRTVLVHPSFIPSDDLLQEILTMIMKAEEKREGYAHWLCPRKLWSLSHKSSSI
jgi:hypothetical protein